MKLIDPSDITRVEKANDWHQGYATFELHYDPIVQIDTVSIYFGFDRPIDRLRLIKVINECVCYNKVSGLLVDSNILWYFLTSKKQSSYNPLHARIQSAAIVDNNDNWLAIPKVPTDLNLYIDYFEDSTNNFFAMKGDIYSNTVYTDIHLQGKISLIFEYKQIQS